MTTEQKKIANNYHMGIQYYKNVEKEIKEKQGK